jgi:hypothetical protein
MLNKIQLKPGINRDQTNYSGEGGWWQCDKIRFRSGYPEKVGGWAKYSTTAVIGVCRQVWNWLTSYQDDLLALGTNKKVYVEAGTNFYDITPLRATFTTAVTDNCFDTTNGSKNVNINIAVNGALAGDYVTFSGATGPVGGVPASELNSEFVIVSVTDANNFIITVTTTATSTTSGGGTAITAEFQIHPGYAIRTAGYGFGAGAWARNGWGAGSTVPIYYSQRDWFFDNIDDTLLNNNLVMNIRNGPIYYWERGTGVTPNFTTRAVLLSSLVGATDVPDEAMQVLTSPQSRNLLAFGCTPYGGGDSDPLLIRWSDQAEPTIWNPLVTNSAGFLRISRGSRIIRALPSRQEILVWTDSNLYTLQFLGTTDVFGIQEYADNISIISPRAVISANNVTFWMGQDKFYAYSGRVETLPCTLRNHIFQNLNYNQAPQIVCGTNEGFHEVWWFYPSKNSDINDSYAIYNYLEQIWYYGTIERTAWNDSALRTYPQAVTYDVTTEVGYIYNHEYGVDDGVLGMEAYIQSNDIDIEDGDKLMLTKRIIPDVNFNGSDRTANPTPTAVLTLRPRSFPGSPYSEDASDSKDVIETTVDEYTNQVFIRARARQMALKISSTDIGVKWQMGSPRVDARPSGRR